MSTWTYRIVVVGSLLSSFLVGMHTPFLHEMLEHGATPRWDVIGVTLVLAVFTLIGAVRLWREDARRRP